MTSDAPASPAEVVYEVVDVADVPLDVWLAGKRALYWVEDDLGLDLRIEWIREVSPHMADVALSMARLDLLFHRLQGKTFVEPTAFRSRPLAGQVGWIWNEGVMRVRCDQSSEEVVRTVAHEAKHIADSRVYAPPRTDEAWRVAEERARAYEARVWAQLADTARVKA